MNVCPYTNDSTTCGALSQDEYSASTIAYCQKCCQVAFRCASGHWNRAFARYCTICSQELEKPEVWGMASANPQRTATLPQMPSVDSLNINGGFGSWFVDFPKIETSETLPGLLAVDGYIVMPNPSEMRLDVYPIAKHSDQRSPSLKWSIAFNDELNYGSTPIYHGLHLYYIVSGGIQKQSVMGGETKSVKINHVDSTQIEPLPECAPLKCDMGSRPAMVIGLKQGVLLFDFTNNVGNYIKDDFFDAENEPMSPTLCGTYVVFTSKRGSVFSLNIGTNPYKKRCLPPQKASFSAPVSLNGLVYFEALNDSGARNLIRFDPTSGKLLKVKDLDSEPIRHLEARRALFVHPPLTDGRRRLFLSDRSGHKIHTYDSDVGFLLEKNLPRNEPPHRFVPHQSIVVNNKIYSAHTSGLSIVEFEPAYTVRYRSLAMGLPTAPSPITRPIRYGDKLFILCKDRLLCMDY